MTNRIMIQLTAVSYTHLVWEKATSIAQAGIATALAITEALPNIPLSILIGALAVSYTHLDVYKRQNQRRILLGVTLALSRLSMVLSILLTVRL